MLAELRTECFQKVRKLKIVAVDVFACDLFGKFLQEIKLVYRHVLKNSNVKKLFFEVISSELIFKFHFVEPALNERVISGFNKLLEKEIVFDFPNICSIVTVLEAIKVNDFEQVRAINFGEVHILNKVKMYSFAILNCI